MAFPVEKTDPPQFSDFEHSFGPRHAAGLYNMSQKPGQTQPFRIKGCEEKA